MPAPDVGYRASSSENPTPACSLLKSVAREIGISLLGDSKRLIPDIQISKLLAQYRTLLVKCLSFAACLYSYSHLSFGDGLIAQTCAEHYQLLCEFMMEYSHAKPTGCTDATHKRMIIISTQDVRDA